MQTFRKVEEEEEQEDAEDDLPLGEKSPLVKYESVSFRRKSGRGRGASMVSSGGEKEEKDELKSDNTEEVSCGAAALCWV